MKLVRYVDEECSALYIDGVLDNAGDHYIIDERISELLKVKIVNSDAFFMGGNDYETVAQTLDELHAYERKLEADEDNDFDKVINEAHAQDLERQAAELEKQAADLLELAKQARK